MSIYKQFGTNIQAEQAGIDITFAANDDGSIPTFRVARMGGANKRYTTELTRRTRPLTAAIRNNTLGEEKAQQLSMEVFVEAVLLGWSNIFDVEGTPLPYSKQLALKLFSDLPDLYEELVRQASALTSFQTDELEATAKN
jgi:hypothetical protein